MKKRNREYAIFVRRPQRAPLKVLELGVLAWENNVILSCLELLSIPLADNHLVVKPDCKSGAKA